MQRRTSFPAPPPGRAHGVHPLFGWLVRELQSWANHFLGRRVPGRAAAQKDPVSGKNWKVIESQDVYVLSDGRPLHRFDRAIDVRGKQHHRE